MIKLKLIVESKESFAFVIDLPEGFFAPMIDLQKFFHEISLEFTTSSFYLIRVCGNWMVEKGVT